MGGHREITQTQKILVPLKVRTSYLTARKIAAKVGGKLPSNILLEEYLSNIHKCQEIISYFGFAWAREILVYPEKGGKFKKGKDIVDSETGWVFPASYVPRDATGRAGVGLCVDPGEITEEKGKIIVHGGKIIVLSPFIQEDGINGKVDEKTGVPLATESEPSAKCSPRRSLLFHNHAASHAGRLLHRTDSVGVRPMARSPIVLLGKEYETYCQGGGVIYADKNPNGVLRAMLEVGFSGETRPASTRKGDGICISGVSRETLAGIVKNSAEKIGFQIIGDGFPVDDAIRMIGLKKLLNDLGDIRHLGK